MKQITEHFNTIRESYPNLSDCMIFVKMVKGKKVSKFDLRKWFDKLVPKDDYKGTPKEQILEWLSKEVIYQKEEIKSRKSAKK